jgi:sec-independent protein translocase protein TatA
MFHLPSGPDLIFIFGLALIIFGPKKLPEIGRTIGQGLRELRKASREITDAFDISDITSNMPRLSDFLADDHIEPQRAPDPVPDHTTDVEPDPEPVTDLDSQKENQNNADHCEPDAVLGLADHCASDRGAVWGEETAGDRKIDG